MSLILETFTGSEGQVTGRIVRIGLYQTAVVQGTVPQLQMIMFTLLQIHFLLQIRQLPSMQLMLHLSIWTGRVLQIIQHLI